MPARPAELYKKMLVELEILICIPPPGREVLAAAKKTSRILDHAR